MSETAYLIVVPQSDTGKIDPAALETDRFRLLSPTLALAVTGLSRSKVYHRVKHQLGDDVPLLVAPLSGPPKFKGLDAGATRWVRENL